MGTHEVDARHLLGDGVFDLDAGVHLDEEPLFFIHIVEKFDCSRVVVADAGGETHGGLTEVATHAGVEVHGRRDLDHLLVAALDGAVALVEVEDISVTVAEDLHLDVLRARYVFFEEHGGIAERAARFALRLVEQRRQILGFLDHAHAAPATSEGRFDDERKPDFFRDPQCLAPLGHGILGAGKHGDMELLGERSSGGLVAHGIEETRIRPHESNARLVASPGKPGVLGEEPVAGMDHVHAAFACEGDDALDIEIRTNRPLALADDISLVGLEAVHGVAVLLRVDRDGSHAELGGCAEDADGDFAAVGDEEGFSGDRNGRGGGLGFHTGEKGRRL